MDLNTYTLTRERAKRNAFLLGLLSNCLIRKSVDNCPLDSVAMKNLDEQVIYIEGLSDSEIARIVLHHKECFAKHSRRPRRR